MSEKKIVHYIGEVWAAVGQSAFLVPVDHTNHVEGQRVSNNLPVRTSTVVSYDKEAGVVETLNTIYKPLPLPV